MKKMIGLFLIVLLALASISLANAGNFYLTLSGAKIANNVDTSGTNGNIGATVKLNNPFIFPDATLGFRLNGWLDLEIGRNSMRLTGNGSTPQRYFQNKQGFYEFGEKTVFLDNKIIAYSLNVKFRDDWGDSNPYIIVGLGLMNSNLETRVMLQGTELSKESFRQTKPCGQAGLGIEYGLPNFRIFVEGTKWQGLGGNPEKGVKSIRYTKYSFGWKVLF